MLIWLPSPLGDAIMATGTLRAIRSLFGTSHITFLGSAFTREILSPSPFCNDWLDYDRRFWPLLKTIRSQRFDMAILLKNSFGSALCAAMAGIGRRVGYARDGRSFLLTDRIEPLRDNGVFKPVPMIEYYQNIASFLGSNTASCRPELSIEPGDTEAVFRKLPALKRIDGPFVILVPGGAFGPSKLWPVERYAQLADKLRIAYHATILISVAPVTEETDIAASICKQAACNPLNIAQTPVTGGQLKALFSLADLVITNDTGPRHIAIALDKNVVSLFGPNNPQWTLTGHPKEIQIVGQTPCAPCNKPRCRLKRHMCMESITVEQVFSAASRFLEARTDA